jgi:DNA-binding MurR/RpiR family transcriptional regulator
VARPPQLDDVDWLRARYSTAGYKTIATELGVSPGTVRRACQRLGLGSAPPGRRSGDQIAYLAASQQSVHERVFARYFAERDGTVEDPLALLKDRLAFYIRAQLERDDRAADAALEATAVAAMIALDRQQATALAA